MLDLGVQGAANVLIVILAFSALIFVHELGHYLAAIYSGVRVERFFLGFDAWGLGLNWERNGCVYGIGILPLGGYVKLAGQSDDPRYEEITGATDELRSKPLRSQALVFVAGVVMNFIFGYLLLVCAYSYGIPFIPNVLGELDPQGPAAVHGLRTGDRVLSVNGRPVETFLGMQQIIAESPDQDLIFSVRRETGDGGSTVFQRSVRGLRDDSIRGNLPTIGASAPVDRIVSGLTDHPEFPEYQQLLHNGDRIVAVNGVAIPPYHGHLIEKVVENLPGQNVELTVERADGDRTIKQELDLPLETYGEYDLGLRFQIQCMAVTPGSPAAEAGLKAGSLIDAVVEDGQPVYFRDSGEFIKRLADHALNSVELTVQRDGKEEKLELAPAAMPGDPRVTPAEDTFLGLRAVPHTPAGFEVKEVFAEGPAHAKLKPGDVLLTAGGRVLDAAKPLGGQIEQASSREVTILAREKAGDEEREMRLKPRYSPLIRRPLVGIMVQRGGVAHVEPGSPAAKALGNSVIGKRLVGLLLSRDLATTTLIFAGANGPERQILDTPNNIRQQPLAAGLKGRLLVAFSPVRVTARADSLPAAMRKAGEEWVDMSLMIYRVIYKLFSAEISVQALGGPVLLFRSIKGASDVGWGYLLYWVALISINLGVCNLLPFPVLDGGHLLFLLIELVKGSPPSLRVKEVAQYVGIACLLALMLTVTGFDIFYLFNGNG